MIWRVNRLKQSRGNDFFYITLNYHKILAINSSQDSEDFNLRSSNEKTVNQFKEVSELKSLKGEQRYSSKSKPKLFFKSIC